MVVLFVFHVDSSSIQPPSFTGIKPDQNWIDDDDDDDDGDDDEDDVDSSSTATTVAEIT